MLKLPTKIDNKIAFALQVGIGIYLAALFFSQSIIYDLIYIRFGLAISNDSPFLTSLLLFMLTAPLSIILCSLVTKGRIQYDTALQAGMIANYSFALMFSTMLLVIHDNSIFAFIGLLFFASIFGFAVSAISAAIYEKLYPLKKNLIP